MRRLCGEGLRSYLGRSRLVPERATAKSRSGKSAEAVVARGQAGEAGAIGEGPNAKDSHETCCLATQCIRSPASRGARQ